MRRADSPTPWDGRLGERLRQARLQALRTQDEVARALAIDRSTLAKWELGQRRMMAHDLVQLAALYRVSLEALVGREEALAPPTPQNGTTPSGDGETTADAARQLIGQFLEQHPALLPAVLMYIEQLAGSAATDLREGILLTAPLGSALHHVGGLNLNQVAPMQALQILMELQHALQAHAIDTTA